MSVTANLTTNVETITATIVVEDETIITQVSAAARGPAGEAGEAGPNEITTATTTNLDGFISGNGTNIAGATAAASAATANTLVRRTSGGGASFAGVTLSGINTNSGSYSQVGGANFIVETTSNANLTTTGSGTVTVSGAGGTTISGGPLTISASSATFATGSIATSQPLTLTQTWTDAAVTYTGLQVNITDTASAAASLLMDLRVGGVSRFRVDKAGLINTTSDIVAAGNLTIRADSGNFSLRQGNVILIAMAGSAVTLSRVNSITFSTDLKLERDAANTLAQRNGTAAQESRIYGTYTDNSNYRRLALKMSTAGVAQIVAEGGGAGAADNRLEFVTGGATRMTVEAGGAVNVSGAVTAAGNVTLGTASAGSTLSFVPRSAQNITQVILSTAADEMIIGETGAGKRVIFGGGAQNNFMRSSGMSTAGLVVGATSAAVSGVAYIAGTLGVGIAAPTTALDVVGSIKSSGTIQTGGYTFATLPTPTQGMRTFITDGADIPLFMANAAGGGTTVTPVFYDGTNWINA
jgi:hypothetical protein